MLGLMLAALLAASEPAVLRVGMDTRSRPWVFVPGLDYSSEDFKANPRITPTQVDELVGVEVDILNALATRLGVKTRIVPVVWEGIEPGLLEKKYDVIMNAWVPSTRTPAGIAVTDPYNDWGLLVVVRSDNTAVRSFADLAGKTVGHFEDPSVDRSIISLQPAHRVPFEDSDQLFAALAAGKLDAAVEDSTYVRWRVAHEPGFRIVGGPLNRVGYRMAVRADDRALLLRLNTAIKELRDSGELARIRTRWESPEAPGR